MSRRCALYLTHLRATRHSDGEDEVRRPIEDVSAPLGSILWAEQANYHAWAPRGQVECTCEFKAKAALLVGAFMERMAALEPVFGFASAWDEYRHRNHLVSKIRYRSGVTGTSEQFIGRDTSKYVPGLYWLTLLPEALASRHDVPLAEVAKVALEHTRLAGGQHLFRFHERPEDWAERRQALDEVCASLPGVFNIADVKRLVAGVTDDGELDRIVSPWR